MAAKTEELVKILGDFDRSKREKALRELAAGVTPAEPTGAPQVNAHLHTFFSFNFRDYSPARLIWEARHQQLLVAGSVDFDVLDALEELFLAGDLLAVRTVAALETRVFVPEYAQHELNSPGEPGVSYFMGTGFAALPDAGSCADQVLQQMRDGARQRNLALLKRLEPVLTPLSVNYERDVLPLTPSGNATERHMLAAFDNLARQKFPAAADLTAYWAKVLGLPAAEIEKQLGDTAKFRNTVRAKLMKKGGPGYVQPDETTFPPVREVIAMIEAARAIPCATWLDGTSSGEADAEAMLDYFLGLGCLAFNIIPDRNWNISDAEQKRVKTAKLAEVVAAAKKRDLIFSVGTEMNNYGQKFVDTFAAPEMAPYAEDFVNGALILYGHTALERAAGLGRLSPWAKSAFGQDRAAANRFYLAVGRGAFPPAVARNKLQGLDGSAQPADVLRRLEK